VKAAVDGVNKQHVHVAAEEQAAAPVPLLTPVLPHAQQLQQPPSQQQQVLQQPQSQQQHQPTQQQVEQRQQVRVDVLHSFQPLLASRHVHDL
jgi:hypothetical protein